MGLWRHLAGLLFGRPGGDTLPVERFAEYDQAILQVIDGALRTAVDELGPELFTIVH